MNRKPQNKPSGQWLTWLLFVALLPLVCVVVVEDYLTGLLGYAMAPALKMFSVTPFAVAGMLQLIPLTVMLTRPTPVGAGRLTVLSWKAVRQWVNAYLRNPLTLVQLGCLLVDGVYDATYRTSITNAPLAFGGALVESVVIFTLFSEILFVWVFTNCMERGAALLLPLGAAVREWWVKKRLEAHQAAALSGNGTERYARAADDDEEARVARLPSALGARAGR